MPNQEQIENAVNKVTYRDTFHYWPMILLPNRELMQAQLCFTPNKPFPCSPKQEWESNPA